VIGWKSASGAFGDLTIAPRHDEYRVIEGFDCDKVDARSDEQKAHASRSWVKKQDAFASFNDGPGALTGFIKPADMPASSPFGPTRKYIGVSKVTGEPCESVSVHQGYDMAAPVGTPIVAPADGTVILADPDLYYEGGAVFLDHGHGLVSVFMHLSEVDVKAGDVVSRGDLLAKSGNTGRTTGPHLHWAVKWRNPEASDRGGDFYIDPALLLELPVTD
jgi:murein DD-endopeptidase MepM/ murein hydrolase activator NlpD